MNYCSNHGRSYYQNCIECSPGPSAGRSRQLYLSNNAVSQAVSQTVYKSATLYEPSPIEKIILAQEDSLNKQQGTQMENMTVQGGAFHNSALTDAFKHAGVVPYTPPSLTHNPPPTVSRKDQPIFSGVLQYFPDAIAAVSHHSKKGNDKHNPGQPMHWAREKSTDHADCIARHLTDIGPNWDLLDPETGSYHAAALAWRALALLQTVIERQKALDKKPENK